MRVNRGADPAAVSRSPETVAAYAADPLVFRTTTLGWYAALGRALERAWSGAATLHVPTWLAWAGADRLVDPGAPPRWAARAPAERVTLSERPGLFHELLNEPERDRVLGDLADWLAAAPTETAAGPEGPAAAGGETACPKGKRTAGQ